MDAIIKKTATTLKENVIGVLAGGAIGYYVAHKTGHVANKWALAGIIAVTAIVGAEIESKMKAKHSAPTAATVAGK